MEPTTKDITAALDQITKIEAKAKQMLDLCATLRRALKAEAGDADDFLDVTVEAARKRPEWVVVDEGGTLTVQHEQAPTRVGPTAICVHGLTWVQAQAHLERTGAGRGWSRWSETKYAPIPQKS